MEGDDEGALRRHLRLLEVDDDEHAHVGAVHALVRMRRHGQAHRRYDAYRRCMTELGLPTEPLPSGPAAAALAPPPPAPRKRG